MADLRSDPRVDELVTLILTVLNASSDPLTMWSEVEARINKTFFAKATR